jgi:hypothetical protein
MLAEVTDKREMMANQLLGHGWATWEDILRASLCIKSLSDKGEKLPLKINGLDINPEALPDQKIELKPFLDAESSNRGSANEGGERVIKISTENIAKHGAVGVYSVLGHEGVHIMQADHSYRNETPLPAPLPLEAEALAEAQKKSLFGKMIHNMFGSKKHKVVEAKAEVTKFASDLIMEELMGHKKDGGPVSRYTSRNIGQYTNFFGVSNQKVYEQLVYLRQGCEIQARVHQIMIDGYQRWGKLPANKDEYLAAMKNSGMKLPEEIEKHLEGLSANSSAKHFLNAERGLKTQMIADIQLVSDSLMPNSRNVFWNKSMPAIYADLIEMYGDKPGRERFGLGKNPRVENPVKLSEKPVTPKDKPTAPSP